MSKTHHRVTQSLNKDLNSVLLGGEIDSKPYKKEFESASGFSYSKTTIVVSLSLLIAKFLWCHPYMSLKKLIEECCIIESEVQRDIFNWSMSGT